MEAQCMRHVALYMRHVALCMRHVALCMRHTQAEIVELKQKQNQKMSVCLNR